MKKHIYRVLFIFILTSTLVSCEGWLTEPAPGVTTLKDFFTTGKAAIQAVNGTYVPLMWEFNSTYYPEWFIGDVMSDDALKGGQSIGDMSSVYDMENFKTATNNTYLLDFYRAQYQGIARANLVLEQVPLMKPDTTMNASLKNRLLGEARYLRAMYYFRLVRVFGGVPKVDFVIQSSNQWKQPRANADSIYSFIISDLESANALLWRKSKYQATDLGRATKGAAQAMLLKTYLYTKQYEKAKAWGDSIIASNEYALVSNYADNFTLAGENGKESVFEIQYMDDPTSDYGQGNGFTRGTFTVILTRSRSSKAGGWGFNKPTQNLYDSYETSDPRRDETIFNPTDADMTNPNEEIYLGSRYLNKKYAMMKPDGSYIGLSHFSRGPINNKVIRYADVLLMYAEACCELNTLDRAKWALEEVRNRARGGNAAILPAFPNYNSYSDNQTDLRKAIRHERRVELAMEGHRWFDICRWGIAKETMDTYKAGETAAAQAEMSTFVAGKHELFPIPAAEIDLNPMAQNPGY
ncbi:MAG: RagB/SusD family nutrient uptake outer membrane protein [Paludibacter sp.]|nr:RagB/SusD family nutrient uptake outer membrane protein [Paludibacter sp.]